MGRGKRVLYVHIYHIPLQFLIQIFNEISNSLKLMDGVTNMRTYYIELFLQLNLIMSDCYLLITKVLTVSVLFCPCASTLQKRLHTYNLCSSAVGRAGQIVTMKN